MTHCYTFQFNLWFNYNRNLFFFNSWVLCCLEKRCQCKSFFSIFFLLCLVTQNNRNSLDNPMTRPEHGQQTWCSGLLSMLNTDLNTDQHRCHKAWTSQWTDTDWVREKGIYTQGQTDLTILFYSMSQFTLFSSKPQYRIAAAAANRSQITLVTSITVTICNCFWHRRDGPDKCFHKLDRDWCTFGLCVSCSLESLINSTGFQQNFIS